MFGTGSDSGTVSDHEQRLPGVRHALLKGLASISKRAATIQRDGKRDRVRQNNCAKQRHSQREH